MKITNFNRANIKGLRPSLEQALKQLETQYGISVKVGNATFTPNSVTFKVELATVQNGMVMSKEVQDFKRSASYFGLQASDLGRTFKSFDGELYTVTGMKSRSSKYPILASRKDGKVFKFPASAVKAGLQRQTFGEV